MLEPTEEVKQSKAGVVDGGENDSNYPKDAKPRMEGG